MCHSLGAVRCGTHLRRGSRVMAVTRPTSDAGMTHCSSHGPMATLGRGLGLLVVGALLATVARADEPTPTSLGWRDLHCRPPVGRHRSGCFERGFDGMAYVADAQGRARLGVTGYVQLRADFNEREDDTTTRFDLERFRLIFEGQVTKHWLVHVRLGLNDGTEFGVPLAYITWQPTERLSLSFGQQFIAVSREDWMFAEDLLTTEYSANDSVFGTGVGEGLQAAYQGRRDRIYAAINSGDLGPRTEFLGQVANAEWSLSGRYERQLATTDWSTWDDLIGRTGNPRGVLIGAGLAVSHISEGDDGRDDVLGTIDVSYSWGRGQALAYGTARRTRRDDGTSFTQYGFLTQAGHFVKPTLLAYGRYELVAPGSQPGSHETYQSVTLGCSYLPFRWTNRARLSLEASQLFTGISRTIVPAGPALGFLSSSEPQLYVRLQSVIGL